MKHDVSITLTCQELTKIAACSNRMTGYAKPDGTRLITVIHGQDGTPVRLILDRQCIMTDCKESGKRG